jgi:hypothetical protein
MFAYKVHSAFRTDHRGLGLALSLIGFCGMALSGAAYGANSKAAAAPLKVYISVDMEGIAGLSRQTSCFPVVLNTSDSAVS